MPGRGERRAQGASGFSGIARWWAIHQGNGDKGLLGLMHAARCYRGITVPGTLTKDSEELQGGGQSIRVVEIRVSRVRCTLIRALAGFQFQRS